MLFFSFFSFFFFFFPFFYVHGWYAKAPGHTSTADPHLSHCFFHSVIIICAHMPAQSLVQSTFFQNNISVS